MNQVKAVLREYIRNRNTVFVFPSEVAALFWREEALRCTDVRAIEASRFLSWDRFKEYSFSLTRREKPVNSTLRLCFVHKLLEEHAERGIPLYGIIPEGHRNNGNAFVSYMERLLPSLGLFPSIQESLHLLEGKTAETISFLYHEYSRFLESHGLFEPSFEVPDLSALDIKAVVFFPELIEDFSSFREVLESHPAVRIFPFSKIEYERSCEFRYFQNSLHETRWFLNRLLELLEEGILPKHISVTVADPALIAHLRHQAELYNIPLDFRMGDTISAYPGGRIFARIADCVRSNFHMDDLKKLFLAGGVPWKRRDLIEALIETGIGTRAVVDSVSGNPGEKRWVRALAAAGEKECSDYIAGLQTVLRRIHHAKTVELLREELQRFFILYVDDLRWAEEEKKVFQYALDMLAGIETSLSGIRLPESLTPFRLFIYHLDKTIYVPKTSRSGISVYPYRVAAGTSPSHHFVLGVSQENCDVLVDACRFLRKDEKNMLDIEDIDMGDIFLEAYAASGDQVWFSSGSETFGGRILVPEFFLEHAPGTVAGEPESAQADLFGKERAVWEGKPGGENVAGAGPIPRLFPVQKRGFFRAEQTCLAEKRFDATETRMPGSGMFENGEIIRISPTSLEEFARCPFSFLFSRILRIEEQEYNTRYDDPLYLGRFAHETAKLVFREIRNMDGAFDAGNIETYGAFVEKAIHTVRRGADQKGFFFIPPVWADISRRTGKWFEKLFELEEEEFNGLAVLETERRFEARPREENFSFYGQIDRLSGTREKAVLIDYKKKNRVKKADIAGSESDPPVSFQIPIYMYLAEAEGNSVARAGYISFEEGKFVPVLSSPEDRKGWFSREELDRLIEETVGRAAEAVEEIRAGKFTAAGPGCEPCGLRGVCRVKYIVG